MDKYKDIIDKALALAEAIAAETATPWDDYVASVVRNMLSSYLGVKLGVSSHFDASGAATLSPELLVLVGLVAQWLLSRLKK